MKRLDYKQLYTGNSPFIKDFLLYVANSLSQRGILLVVDDKFSSNLNDFEKTLFNMAVESGIVEGASEVPIKEDIVRFFLPKEYLRKFKFEYPDIDKVFDKLAFYPNKEEYFLHFDSVERVISNEEVYDIVGNSYYFFEVLEQLVAEYFVRVLLKEDITGLLIFISNNFTKFSHRFYELFISLREFTWLPVNILFQGNVSYDLELECCIAESFRSGNVSENVRTLNERAEALSKEGICKGSIVSIYELDKRLVVDSNKFSVGKVIGQWVGEIIAIKDGRIEINLLPCFISRAERRLQYLEISEDMRYIYESLLDANISPSKRVIPLSASSVGNSFSNEDLYIITKFDSSEIVSKSMLDAYGDIFNITLSAPAMVYALLEDWNYSFDKGKYLEMYGNDILEEIRNGYYR